MRDINSTFMKYLYSILSIAFFFVSCKKEEVVKPKVKYDTSTRKEVFRDTSKLGIVDLPIHFEGASVLVFPVGDLTVGDVNKGNYESSKTAYDNSANFNISNSMENEITGFFRNVKFQVIGQDSLRSLTEQVILIENMSYLKSKKTFVYTLSDNDTNQDNSIDNNDLNVLYLSDEQGSNFIKISPDLQEIIDWEYIEASGKLFFRTLDDANKNGQFDKNDNVHYFYYDFKQGKSIEFKPL